MTVIGDQPVALLRDIAQRLENFRAGVATLIQDAQRPAPMPTVVFVFGARKVIQPFLPLGKDGRPAAFGGFFHRDADVNYIALSLEGFDDNLPVIFHDYTHLLVGQNGGGARGVAADGAQAPEALNKVVMTARLADWNSRVNRSICRGVK